jgi:syntaxin 16
VGAATRRAGGEEATVGANIQRSLAKRLQEMSMDFRQSQRKYLAEVQAQKSGEEVNKFGIELDHGDFFNTQQLAVVDDLTEAVQSRDKEIQKIAQSIEELGQIFKELAVLVIDQGTILDRIDYNMEAVVEHTKTGIQQLEKAEHHQKSARPMKCILCLISLIGVLLIILVLKHRRRF